MRVTRQSDRLVLRDAVAPFWALGLLLVVGGLLGMALPLGLASNVSSLEPWERMASLAVGAMVAAGGVWWLVQNPASRVEVDVAQRQVRLTQRGLSGRRTQHVAFDDIATVQIEYSRDSDGDPVCRAALSLRSGDTVRLSALWSHDTEGVGAAVAAVAEATGAPVRRKS